MLGAEELLPRRQNGRPAACNACRARKVACDHTRPTCNRCQKRGDGTPCVYSEEASRPPKRYLRPDSESEPCPLDMPTADEPRPTKRQSQSSLAPRQRPLDGQRRRGSIRPLLMNCFTTSRGYLGAASYGAVFEEAKNSLPSVQGPLSTSARGSIETTESDCGCNTPFEDLPSTLQEMCLSVLRCLPGQSNERLEFSDAPGDTDEISGTWSDIAARRIAKSLRELLIDVRGEGEEGLRRLAGQICENTTRPMGEDFTDPQDWLAQFCGPELRWESLGLLWAHLERMGDPVTALSARGIEWLDGRYSTETAFSNLSCCIDVSLYYVEGSVLLLDLCRRRATLDSVVSGDSSLTGHISHNVGIAMMYFQGLHVQEATATYKPTFCSENKRRLFAQCHIGDKLGVIFCGRPPSITSRYCTTPLPLDLRDEDLLAGEETLAKAVRRLDENGWNTEGGLYPATLIRARTLNANIRDELVDIALSRYPVADMDRLLDIRARQRATFAGFPKSLIYSSQDLENQEMDSHILYLRLFIQLDHCQNVFFAERLLLLHGCPDRSDILTTSFQMLSLVLLLWIHRERFGHPSIRRQFHWLLLSYGAPPGGILCLELLQPTFSGVHPKDSRLSRSSIVQQLSLLVAFLDWIRPSGPNEDLCADCQAVVQSVLDHHLNSDSTTGSITDGFNWGSMTLPDFNFELMDTFDWLRTDTQ